MNTKYTIGALLVFVGGIVLLLELIDRQAIPTSLITPIQEFVAPARIPTPTPIGPPPMLLGEISWTTEEEALVSLASASAQLSFITPAWYTITQGGSITPITTRRKNEIRTLAKQRAIRVLPVISIPSGQNKTVIKEFLSSNSQQETIINHLVDIAQEFDYAGFTLRLGEVEVTSRANFTQFAKDLAQSLASIDRMLIVTSPAKTGNEGTDNLPASAYDWNALGEIADLLAISALDYHHTTSQPGPITPLDWYAQVLAYAKKTIPAQKIVLEVPTYGYDWGANTAVVRSFPYISKILTESQSIPIRDAESGALKGLYESRGVVHTVWFEDATSIYDKIMRAQEEGIHSFLLYSLGTEDPAIWSTHSPTAAAPSSTPTARKSTGP